MDHLTCGRIGDLLAAELNRSGRGVERWTMSPGLSYGRHRGPATVRSRAAAVAIAIYPDPDLGWCIPLTLRPIALSHHPGQISLPGGKVETGESTRDAALREFEEELGVAPRVRRHCGQLSPQFVYASDHHVHPLVFLIDHPGSAWTPDPREVAEVITLPLRLLNDTQSRISVAHIRSLRRADQTVGKLSFRSFAFQLGPHQVWGATAMILEELASRLRAAGVTADQEGLWRESCT